MVVRPIFFLNIGIQNKHFIRASLEITNMFDIKDEFIINYNTKKNAVHLNANISDVSIKCSILVKM